MTKTWFTSDTHFGHANIIGYCNRPFTHVDEMDDTLIANWNKVVGKNDIVWHLGDFCFEKTHSTESYLSRLNGVKHLIWGNHDTEKSRQSPLWASSQFGTEIRLDGMKITLLHYAQKVWLKSGRGALMFYGHSHSNLPGNSQSTDVGVDETFTKFSPVSLKQVRAHLATLPLYTSVDHHKPDPTSVVSMPKEE